MIISVNEPSIASQAGLLAGDRIVSLAGHSMASWQDVGMQLIKSVGQGNVPVVIKNRRGVSRHTALALHQFPYQRGHASLLSSIGINPDLSVKYRQQVQGQPFLQSLQQAALKLIDLCDFFLIMLKQLLTGSIPFFLLLGPFSFFTVVVHSFLQGLVVFSLFIAHLSLAVALVNLFPIPGLDGGSIVYAMLEKIRGKPVSVPLEVLLHRLALIWMTIILVQLLLNDLRRYL